MKQFKTYFAGPHVFFPDTKHWAVAVRKLCEDTCIVPLIPEDGDVEQVPLDTLAQRIYDKNISMMNECDIGIIDITSFRGASMDCGTAFETGYLTAQNKPVILYSYNHEKDYWRRAKGEENNYGGVFKEMFIEDFGLEENLMICRPDTVIFNSVGSAILYARQKMCAIEQETY